MPAQSALTLTKCMLIISNQRTDAFLDAFPPTSQIKERLDPRWPNQFEVGMPTLDANAMCVFSGWKVKQLALLLQEPFER